MEKLRTTVREVYDLLRDLDEGEFIDAARRLLEGHPKWAVLVAIFLEYESSLSRALLLNLGFWFETIAYDDILAAMIQLGRTELPAYYFASYVPEVFGVDVRKAAREIQEQSPGDADKVAYFANMRGSVGPSLHAMLKLKEFGASPEAIRQSLEDSGAPLLSLPDGYGR